jgi:O-antigen/teichoic acid export membrane protein
LTTGTLWNLIATIFNQGSIIAVNVVVARIVGKQAFGEYSIVVSTLITVATLIQLSMGYTATKYVAEFRSTDKAKTGRILGLCALITVSMACLGTILLIFGASPLATYAMKAPQLTIALMVGAGYLFFSAVNGYQVGVFAGLEAYHNLAKAGIISGIITVFGIALGAWWLQVHGALLGLSVTTMLRCLFHNFWLRKELRQNKLAVTYKDLQQESSIIHSFALPAALSGYVTMPAIWLGNTFLIRQAEGFEQMALYNAALTFRMIVMFLPLVVNNVGLSILNNHKGRGDAVMYWKTFRLTLAVNAGSVILVSLMLLGSGPTLLNLFGKDFGNAYLVLKILLLATLIEGIAISVYQIIQSHAMIWQSLMLIAVPYCLLFVVLAYYLTSLYGAVGLAVAYTAGWAVNLVATCLLAGQITSGSLMSQEVRP